MEINFRRNKPKWLKGEVLKKNLSLGEQSFSLVKQYPQFEATLTSNTVTWIGSIQPRLMSEAYKIKIIYEQKGYPKVWVLDPKLQCYKNEPIPHMYNQERLCLFYPVSKEWKRSMWIYQTIIPWTSLWLSYYEIWLITGEWLGGGIEHSSPALTIEEDDKNYVE